MQPYLTKCYKNDESNDLPYTIYEVININRVEDRREIKINDEQINTLTEKIIVQFENESEFKPIKILY